MTDTVLMADPVTASSVADGVVIITLNRPQSLNALTKSMLDTVVEMVHRYGRSAQTRAIVLTGAGRAFSAGGDVRAITAMSDDELAPYLATYALLDRVIRSCPIPVIAAINGLAYGGGLELACMADIRVADESAVLCAGDLAVGLIPTGGLTWKLPRFIGQGRARWMLLTNAELDAARAERIGLVDIVVPSGAAADEAISLAIKLTSFPTQALASTKFALGVADTEGQEASYDFEVHSNVEILRQSDTRAALLKLFPPRSGRAD